MHSHWLGAVSIHLKSVSIRGLYWYLLERSVTNGGGYLTVAGLCKRCKNVLGHFFTARHSRERIERRKMNVSFLLSGDESDSASAKDF